MAKGESGGLAALIAAKILCCGAVVLAATGALTGLGAWFSDEGVVWLGAAGLLVAAVLVVGLRRRRRAQARAEESIRGPVRGNGAAGEEIWR